MGGHEPPIPIRPDDEWGLADVIRGRDYDGASWNTHISVLWSHGLTEYWTHKSANVTDDAIRGDHDTWMTEAQTIVPFSFSPRYLGMTAPCFLNKSQFRTHFQDALRIWNKTKTR